MNLGHVLMFLTVSTAVLSARAGLLGGLRGLFDNTAHSHREHDALGSLPELVNGVVNTVGQGVLGPVTGVVGSVGDVVGAVPELVNGVVNTVGQGVLGPVTGVVGSVGDVLGAVPKLADGLVSSLGAGLQGVTQGLVDALESVTMGNQHELERILNALRNVTEDLRHDLAQSIMHLREHLARNQSRDENDSALLILVKKVLMALRSHNAVERLLIVVEEELRNGTLVNELLNVKNGLLQANRHHNIPQLADLLRGIRIRDLVRGIFPVVEESEMNSSGEHEDEVSDAEARWFLKVHLKL